jgi:hypothetical protein
LANFGEYAIVHLEMPGRHMWASSFAYHSFCYIVFSYSLIISKYRTSSIGFVFTASIEIFFITTDIWTFVCCQLNIKLMFIFFSQMHTKFEYSVSIENINSIIRYIAYLQYVRVNTGIIRKCTMETYFIFVSNIFTILLG